MARKSNNKKTSKALKNRAKQEAAARKLDEQTKILYWTEEQSDAYLRGRPSFLETDIQNCAAPIRAKLDGGEEVTPEETEALGLCYFHFGSIASHVSNTNFQKIAVDQVRA